MSTNPIRFSRTWIRILAWTLVLRSAVFRQVLIGFTSKSPCRTKSCSHNNPQDMWRTRPTPCLWEKTRALLESHFKTILHSFPVRNLMQVRRNTPSDAPVVIAPYSASQEDSATAFWILVSVWTNVPFQYKCATETLFRLV